MTEQTEQTEIRRMTQEDLENHILGRNMLALEHYDWDERYPVLELQEGSGADLVTGIIDATDPEDEGLWYDDEAEAYRPTRSDVVWEETGYRDAATGTDHVALMVDWHIANAFLGHQHDGSGDDDRVLVEALLAAGAPAWVADAEGWTDEHGWGLIGPVIEEADDR